MARADALQAAQLLSLSSVSGLTDMDRMCGIGLKKSCEADPAAGQSSVRNDTLSYAQADWRQVDGALGEIFALYANPLACSKHRCEQDAKKSCSWSSCCKPDHNDQCLKSTTACLYRSYQLP